MTLHCDQLRIPEDLLGKLRDLPGRAITAKEFYEVGLRKHLVNSLRRRSAVGIYHLCDVSENRLFAFKDPGQNRILYGCIILHFVNKQMLHMIERRCSFCPELAV